MAEKLGALRNLTRGDFDKLSLGVQGQNNATDIFGYSLTPSNAFTTGVGFVSGLGTPMAVGSMIGNYQSEQAANKLLGNPTNFRNNVKQPGNPNSAVQTVRGMISDTNKDGAISNYEMNQFGQSIPGLDLASMYIGGNPNKMVRGAGGKTMPSSAKANPYSSGRLSQQMNAPRDRGTLANEFKSAMGSYALKDMADQGTGVKSVNDYAGDAINQTNITNYDPTKGTYDKAFAKAVQIENQGSEGGGGGGTYICTALYEMGDMKKTIYKYDQVYGKRVDPNVYRGYCVWGKYVATKLRHKGIVYKIAKPLALGWARQMAFDLSKGKHGKNNKVVKVISRIGESVCYALGVIANIKLKKGVRYG